MRTPAERAVAWAPLLSSVATGPAAEAKGRSYDSRRAAVRPFGRDRRAFLGLVVRQMLRADRHDLRTRNRLFVTVRTEGLRDSVVGAAAAPFVAENNENFFASVRGVTNVYTAAP
jgi:hypothetical protein